MQPLATPCYLVPHPLACSMGCCYTGADKGWYEPSKELQKAAAYYYDVETPPWALIMEVDMQVGTSRGGEMSTCLLLCLAVPCGSVITLSHPSYAFTPCIWLQPRPIAPTCTNALPLLGFTGR